MSTADEGFLVTSESVTEGHPDKVAGHLRAEAGLG